MGKINIVMSDNSIRKIKETAKLILDSEEDDLMVINKALYYIIGEFSKIGHKDYFLILLKVRFDNLKQDYISGILLESDFSSKKSILKFAFHNYLEIYNQFWVVEFSEDYSLALKYSQQSLTNEEIIKSRKELLKAKELSYDFLKNDIENETKFLEKALINVDRVIHNNKIIDKDYLNLKHRYISLKTDLINGIISDISDFYKVLSQIKKAAEIYFTDVEYLSNTSLNQEILENSKKHNPIEQKSDLKNKNPLAPFPDEDIYNEYINTLNLINVKFTMGNELNDRLLKTYILLTKEIKEREIEIKDSDNMLFGKINSLLPIDIDQSQDNTSKQNIQLNKSKSTKEKKGFWQKLFGK